MSQRKILLIALSVIVMLTAGRWVAARFDLSYFIVAGSDFVDSAKTPTHIIVQNSQGYDGQFFYRYSIDPFNFNSDVYGVHVDHPPYRIQRIAYPFIVWLLSFGGNPSLVPLMMVLLNIAAFLGIFFYTNKFIAFVRGDKKQGLLPLLLCGLYMSFSRDLSEVLELCFFTATVYYLFTSRFLLCAVFATCTILTRETSLIGLLPMMGLLTLRLVNKKMKLQDWLYMLIPFVVFGLWKVIIYRNIPSITESAAGYGAFGIPLKGIIQGFRENFNFSDTKNKLQFAFWITYLVWQISFVFTLFKKVSFTDMLGLDNLSQLKIIYCTWLVFALCFSLPIYTDDWGFVRIFSMWNMIGFMILMASKKKTGKLFNICSAALVLLTIVRLIIRV